MVRDYLLSAKVEHTSSFHLYELRKRDDVLKANGLLSDPDSRHHRNTSDFGTFNSLCALFDTGTKSTPWIVPRLRTPYYWLC